MSYTVRYLAINWTIILGSIYFTFKVHYFYPVAFLIIANRQFANYLVGHEGVHGLVSRRPFLNSILSKYFCLFPVFVSFETYKMYHLFHHEFLGTNYDPDKKLYDFYPVKRRKFLKNVLAYFFTGQMLLDFAKYFTPFQKMFRSRSLKSLLEGEQLEFLFFHLAVFLIIVWNGYVVYFILFWLLPVLLVLPYYYFVSALQHGKIHQLEDPNNSRNIIGNSLIMEILLPCATNFHGVHHQYPNVPFYKLKNVFVAKNLKGCFYKDTIIELLPRE